MADQESKDTKAAARTEAKDSRSAAKAEKEAEKAADQAQKVVDKETEQGFRGVEVDGTPNSAYTVQGQLAGEAVPEAAADPVAARREASNI